MVPSLPTPVSRELTSSALIPRVISAIMLPIIPEASSRCAIAFTVPDLLDAVRRHSLLAARPWQLLGRSRECAEGGLEGGQTAADHVGLLQAGAARGPLGVHRGADSLQ